MITSFVYDAGLEYQKQTQAGPKKTVNNIRPVRLAELVQQYEQLRQYAMAGEGPCCGWGLVRLLRWGMAAWIQAQLRRPASGDLDANLAGNQRAPYAECDWVLALAALVTSQRECREVRHG